MKWVHLSKSELAATTQTQSQCSSWQPSMKLISCFSCKINAFVNRLCTVAGVLDQGSKMWSSMRTLQRRSVGGLTHSAPPLEGANGSTSCTPATPGCAENLNMRIGDVSFALHAHTIHTAPFRLLGRPFHPLLCWLIDLDHLDHVVGVDIFICDPANSSWSVVVPSRAHQCAQGKRDLFPCQPARLLGATLHGGT